MKINLNTGENVKKLLYPDNQPHINMLIRGGGWVDVICSLTDSQKLLELCMTANAIEQDFGVKGVLHIPYLMGARYDRMMDEGDSFDLKVIAKIINSLGFFEVKLYDPHSDVAAALIDNSSIITNEALVIEYDKEDAVLIIPDAGAAKKAYNYFKWNPSITDYVQALKHRDLKTGEISHTEILNIEKCRAKHCVIIDDICDGGRTFIEISKALLNAKVYTESLTLIVTHGLFTKGFKELEDHFEQIITSNSLFKTYDSKIVKVVEYEY
jgi:ribose-phosphate pyrophosphokinase